MYDSDMTNLVTPGYSSQNDVVMYSVTCRVDQIYDGLLDP